MSDRIVRRPDAPPPRLDEVDERILWVLASDARIPNNRLAAAVGIAPSTCLVRVRALEDAGIITGYRAEVDIARLGFSIEAMVSVRVHAAARHELREFAKRLLRVPVVLDVSFLAGDKDFLVHIACTSTEQLRDFVADELSGDPSVATTQTSIVFERLVADREHQARSYGELRRWQA
ncbi:MULTISPECIES: Lrp/AsnC family transcriptional regulator [Curtobacterium]|uniref:Lrp/AsnC family transcriptional regulator n=1 Tax=Curtobacterium herbarum TaxID=150122 RepID=A0ABN1ZGL3_9MICO|nr:MULTISPECIES: Lrp/AsnC family transcriptional regulator [Curtobacterium]MBM7474775.1 DNA-binding Lrp family transcriptional regulator [Curtobacterium herbarum]MCS6545425.1 Lrp/AsnC family transcriptional regulator [Curtobacterium herbarum]MDN4649209.1 Lrp/AsnC family transcriptional regulator [Curtobacterium sp. PsM8]PYY37183.1 Lrp/AsnC family transcriptional regulator [Curtobacterium sp. MCBD17_030]PZE35429.1 Lrp/AsnC family transcriptional regulator [Curtobacterium sp. MCPF17_031]